MLVRTTSFITRWAAVLAACWILLATPEAAVAQHHGHRTYCAEGQCIPNRANFGFYQTQWRRWPTDNELEDARKKREWRSPEGIPQYEVPDALDESKTYPGRERKPIVDEPEDVNDDARINPFKDDDPAVPAFDYGTSTSSGGAKGSLTDRSEFGPNRPFGQHPGDNIAVQTSYQRPASTPKFEAAESVCPASADAPIDKRPKQTCSRENINPLRNRLPNPAATAYRPFPERQPAESPVQSTPRRNPLREN